MWLTLEWDKARAALPLSSVFEVLPLREGGADVVSIPRARVSVKGVLAHRGYVVPVFDPRRWKGFFNTLPVGADDYVVLVQNEDSLDGLVVGNVNILPEVELVKEGESDEEKATKPENSAGVGRPFVERLVRTQGANEQPTAWALLSLPRLGVAMHKE